MPPQSRYDPHNLRKVLVKPVDSLFLGIIHCLLVFIAAPVASKRETMDLVFIYLEGKLLVSKAPNAQALLLHTRISCGTSVFLAITSSIWPTLFSSSTLSLSPSAKLKGLVTGSKSPGMATELGWHAYAASTPPTLPSFFPCACKIA